jgi:hypothetical protein
MEEELHINQLLLAKQLFEHGIDHANKDGAINRMIAIHNIHNSIELILKTIAMKLKVAFEKDPHFDKLIGDVGKSYKEKYDLDLPLISNMKNLNSTRNDVQHSGLAPSKEALEKYKYLGYEFIDVVVNNCFEIKFENLSLIEFIEDERLRYLIKLAEISIKENDIKKSMALLERSFFWTKLSIKNITPGVDLGSSSNLDWLKELFRETQVNRKTYSNSFDIERKYRNHIDNIQENIGKSITLLSCGIDLKKYFPFSVFLERIGVVFSKKWDEENKPLAIYINKMLGYQDITIAQVNNAKNFLIEIIYDLQKFGFNPKISEDDYDIKYYDLLVSWNVIIND